MSQGVIFYNTGTGCLARLAVSVYNLRKYYDGDISILSDGPESLSGLKPFSADKNLDVDIVDGYFNVKSGRGHHYLSKCRLHEVTPFDTSLYIDSDTLPVGDVSELFPIGKKHQFAVTQFSNWKSNGPTISRRIRGWSRFRATKNDIAPALSFGPAVNTGVMCFQKDSEFMQEWFRIARKGRDMRIPDETSCQVLLHRFPHKVVPWYFNASCRYDDVSHQDVKIIHYHGRKHCRQGLPYNGGLWVKAFKEIESLNIANVNDWARRSGDRQLKSWLRDRPK